MNFEKKSISVLLVEDDEDHAELIQYTFTKLQHYSVQCEWVEDLDAAEERLNSKDYAAAFVDLSYPGSSPLESLERVSAWVESYVTPLVILTSLDDLELGRRSIEMGLSDFLSKGEISSAVLEKTISHAIERGKISSKLKSALQELERSNRDLSNFAAAASHDLQEPLRTISCFADLLIENQLETEAERLEGLHFIKDSSHRMIALVKAILSHSRIGSGSNRTETDLTAILESIKKDLSTTIEESGVQLRFSKLPTVYGYATELRSLFQNLISNAIKFRRAEGDSFVEVTAERFDGGWRFAVRDNGIGIEEKYQEDVFRIFSRLHPASEYEGTGVGLSSCDKIARLHGSEIELESVYGEGSVFSFTIPDPTIDDQERGEAG